MARKAEPFKEANAIVIDIDLIPGQPVTGRDRMCMMVVVPSLSTGHERKTVQFCSRNGWGDNRTRHLEDSHLLIGI